MISLEKSSLIATLTLLRYDHAGKNWRRDWLRLSTHRRCSTNT